MERSHVLYHSRFAALLSKKIRASESDARGMVTVYWFLSHEQLPWRWFEAAMVWSGN